MGLADSSNLVKSGRILYVEPNNAYLHTSEDGKQTVLTPPLEDLCISVNLTAYVFERTKSNIGSGKSVGSNGQEYNFSWFYDTTNARKFSFLSGDDCNGKEYLTTYYTDIAYENYGKSNELNDNKIVEGLGLEQIQISFESWYTPTVTMKLVDVRGSALFGREEAIHNRKGEITARNVFGCFMTIPYPLFKLQIKGFLGRPVTYQLTCSDVRTMYNAQTGNFEMTVQFIGYTYGLLTDIPINYIVAAPFITYIGADYWAGHVNSEDWAMDNGHPPMKLFDFYEFINGMMEDGEIPNSETSEESQEMTRYHTEASALETLLNSHRKMVEKFRGLFTGCYDSLDENGYRQLLLFTKNKASDLTDFRTAYQEFKSQHDSYNTEYPTNAIPDTELPDYGFGRDSVESENGANNQAWSNLFVISRDNDNRRSEVKYTKLSGDLTVENICKEKIGTVTLTKGIAEKMIKGLQPPFDEVIEQYCSPLDLGTYEAKIKARISELNKLREDLQASINNKMEEVFLEKLGWRPDIGNIFKMVMCHLETFVHVLLEAGSEIIKEMNHGMRTSDRLGITVDKTDFTPDIVNIPPWPAVVGKNPSNNETDDSGGDEEALAWVGDFSQNFIEQKVVEGIMAAVLRMSETKNSPTETSVQPNAYPFTPTDVTLNTPFSNVKTNNSVANLSAQLAERAAVLFGIMCDRNVDDTTASLFGKLDAYNYFLNVNSSIVLNQDIFDRVGNDDLVQILEGIAVCDSKYDNYGQTNQNTGKTRFVFETDIPTREWFKKKGTDEEDGTSGIIVQDRHPMLLANGSDYLYTHYYLIDKTNSGLLTGAMPSSPKSDYNTNRSLLYRFWNTDEYGHHEVKYNASANSVIPTGLIHAGCSDNVLNSRNEDFSSFTIPQQNAYVNKAMFSLIADDSKVSSIIDCRRRADSGSVKVKNYETSISLGNLGKEYWPVLDSDIKDFYHPDTAKTFTTKKGLIHRDSDALTGIWTRTDKNAPTSSDKKSEDVKINDDGVWTGSDNETLDDLCVAYNVVMTNDSNRKSSIMGHTFYYLQDDIKLRYTQDKQSDAEKVKIRAKMLLFLQTLPWSNKQIDTFSENVKHGNLQSVPYGYLLLLGGLLWRSRYIQEAGQDVFVCSSSSISYKPLYNNNIEYTIYENKDGGYVGRIIKSSENANYQIPVHKFFGNFKDTDSTTMWYPDINIYNQLVNLFEGFISDNYNVISQYELTIVTSDKKTKACNAETYRQKAKQYHDLLNGGVNTSNKKYSDIDDTLKKKMGHSFIQIWNNYGLAVPTDGDCEILLMYKPDDEKIQKILKNLFTKKIIVANLTSKRLKNKRTNVKNEIRFSATIYRKYLTSFVETLKTVVTANEHDTPITTNGSFNSNTNMDTRQFCIAIYYYCKNLWDKWLGSAELNTYDVNPFFKNQFVFIDSFYRNIYSKLPINCELVVSLYQQANDVYSLFSYLNDLISKHNCIFFAAPDYVGFTGESSDDEAMLDLFRPITYNEMNKVLQPSNKFIIVYTHRMSEQLRTTTSEYKWDGFDIYAAPGADDNTPPKIFRTDALSQEERKNVFTVPSFGVALNRQNNTIFKNISLNNTNPVQTEASIMAMCNILSQAAGKNGKVTFHGQDMYNIFSNYSYNAEIEMMGNAQIAPLMYFQLLNVPMWRGAYMVYNVTHNITPGNMTTRFKGMKLCVTPTPFATSYMSYYPAPERDRIGDDYGDQGGGNGNNGESAITMQDSYQPPITTPTSDHWAKERAASGVNDQVGDVKYKEDLRTIFNCLWEEIDRLNEGWNVVLSHVVREPGGKSQHCRGEAMDLQIKRNGEYQASGTYKPELIKVIDILFCNHSNKLGQVLLEYGGSAPDNNFFASDKTKYKFHVLHVALQTTKHNKMEVNIVGGKGSNWFNSGKPDRFMQNVMPEFDKVAYRAYKEGIPTLIKHFSDYGTNHDKIRKHFEGQGTVNGPNASSGNRVPPKGRQVPLNNANKVSDYDDLFKKWGKEYGFDWRLLAAISFIESSFNKDVGNSCCHGLMGISLQYSNYNDKATLKIPDNNIHEGARMLQNNWKSVAKYTNNDEEQLKFALAAYNWGIGNLGKAVTKAKNGGKSTSTWYNNVETYAPNETKNYVPWVIWNYNEIKKKFN